MRALGDADQTQIDHECRAGYDGDRQDVNRLHRRDDPVRDLNGWAERRLIDPRTNRVK